MDNDLYVGQQVPSGILKSVTFGVLTSREAEKLSTISIESLSEVNDPRLGLPNSSSVCSSCSAKDLRRCEGHYGSIKFPCNIVHPYFLSEITKILNKVCPGCRSLREDSRSKKKNSTVGLSGCKYCLRSLVDWYPPAKFKVSSKELFRRTAIVVEIDEKFRGKLHRKLGKRVLPSDYWDFIPIDDEQDENSSKPNKRVLTHAQVHYLLKDVDPSIIQKFLPNASALFVRCFPVTPNCHRVTEVGHTISHGQRLIFDDRTRAYRKLVDFRGSANELSCRVLECLKTSKLNPDRQSVTESVFQQKKNSRDVDFGSSGLRFMKDGVLGKRSDHCFRMVVTGNPNIKVNEVGIPCEVAERLQISETVTRWNIEKLRDFCSPQFFEMGEIRVKRKGRLAVLRDVEDLMLGDIVLRPLNDGDIALINRPPSIHQHSHVALNVKILPQPSAVSVNPIVCLPLRGDFDGDCIHGYVPQSVDAKVELKELVALDRQLLNGQSGRNLLSLGQDSLLAAHLILEDGVLLGRFQMQQLQMFCPQGLPAPALIKAPSLGAMAWTGKQLFGMLLPLDFEWRSLFEDCYIRDGEIISSEGSTWLRHVGDNIFQRLIQFSKGKVLDFLHSSQEVLCEWLSMRGFSVSLSDMYLSADARSRKNMLDEMFSGLQEAYEACNIRQLMVNSSRVFLAGDSEDDYNMIAFEPARLSYEKQKSTVLSQVSIDAFRRVFRDVQNLVYRYASKDNSMLYMFSSGSKGNLLRIVQHSMCIGLQHSLVPLPFYIPPQLSCASWNNHKKVNLDYLCEDFDYPKSFIPYGVVESSFLSGLNPLECFVHSVTNRASSFSENAEVPGTLHRKLMFFLRDLYVAYDGTVRSSYGNQVIEFSYNLEDPDTSHEHDASIDIVNCREALEGQPVGPMSACAFSEAAYSALDQPISLLESSPLLNLKNVLECGSKKSNSGRTMSLYLSEKLGKKRHGFEYGALEIKDFLERLQFSAIVSAVSIMFSPDSAKNTHLSPWICHFQMRKDILISEGLKVNTIVDSLQRNYNSLAGTKVSHPTLQVCGKFCSSCASNFCITVSTIENSKFFKTLKVVRQFVIPFLLGTVIRGFPEIKRVDILWSEKEGTDRFNHRKSGEPYLKVLMSAQSEKKMLWSILMNHCIRIMDMIDWSRSHPDNIREFSLAYGVDAGWQHFLNSLQSAVSDTGKSILREHMVLLADSLSATGEFVPLNAKGMARQKEVSSITSPFVQACFSSPGSCFIKAAKAGSTDKLQGSLDALAWGLRPSGIGGVFQILYSAKGHQIEKPKSIYDILASQVGLTQLSRNWETLNVKDLMPVEHIDTDRTTALAGNAAKVFKKLSISKSFLRRYITFNDVMRLSRALRFILNKYKDPENDDHCVGDKDGSILMMALRFHPRYDEKIGCGVKEIKVGYHQEHNSPCFKLVRKDGSVEDFSYHKCVHGALEEFCIIIY
ncbi:hypothetical protein MLD38_039113 [Melastoma candidum]|uniref:Uncharacterized protein n=1 Tax=Melastoma candidum TaxID=119954 RepID=A0ACB9L116_9MYRT|nr:hypothetical protein MLD38_039113 [Melastoma candidum]